MSTKDNILSYLRRERLTVAELAERLDVTRNAVIVQLRQLEADGLVAGQGRKDKRVGKPAVEYSVVAGREDEASKAYPAFAELLVEALPSYLSRDQIQDLMDRVGNRMAAQLDRDGRSDFDERLKSATDFADSVGAETSVETIEGGAIIRSFSCPLGRAVRKEPCVCSTMASFFSKVTGAQVREQCTRGEKLYCEFAVQK